MAKYKVLTTFQDVHTKEVYQEGKVIDMTVKRATEAENRLKKHGVKFFERLLEKE